MFLVHAGRMVDVGVDFSNVVVVAMRYSLRNLIEDEIEVTFESSISCRSFNRIYKFHFPSRYCSRLYANDLLSPSEAA